MVHLFLLDVAALKNDDLFCHWYFQLSSVRQDSVDQCPARSDKSLSLGVGILLDYGLKKIYGLRERDMQYEIGAFLKPCFTNAPYIQFNASHEGSKVLLALSDHPVGCDIDSGVPIEQEIVLHRGLLHPNEIQDYLAHATKEGQDAVFSRYWSLKESFAKAVGPGIYLGMDTFWFDPDGDTPDVHHNFHFLRSEWHFRTFAVPPTYYVSVCSGEDCSSLELETVDFSML